MMTAEASSIAAPATSTCSITSRGHGPPVCSHVRSATRISAPAVRARIAAPRAMSAGASGVENGGFMNPL